MILAYIKLGTKILLYKLSRTLGYPLAKPINITLSITNKCYSRCKSCNVWKIYPNAPNLMSKELKIEEWQKIFQSIGKGPVWFTFTGGETMLREDIDTMVRYIMKYNKPAYINIATSGIYPEKTEKKIIQILDE
ncbi:MAG: radical SAM protein, partial [Nanoarchaeota archaeon]